MNTRNFLFSLLCIAVFTINGFSQNLNELLQNAGNGNEAIQKLFSQGEKVKTESKYHFDANMLIEIVSSENEGEKQIVEYRTYLSKESKNFSFKMTGGSASNPQEGEGLFIYDYENKAMIILSEKDGEKNAIVSSLSGDELDEIADESGPTDEEKEQMQKDFETYFKSTGNTKKINGYSCDEYHHKDEESDVTLWITDDVDIDSNSALRKMNGMNAYYTMNMKPGSFIMQMIVKDLSEGNDDNDVIMTVKEINDSASETIDISGYNKINMGGMFNPSGE